MGCHISSSSLFWTSDVRLWLQALPYGTAAPWDNVASRYSKIMNEKERWSCCRAQQGTAVKRCDSSRVCPPIQHWAGSHTAQHEYMHYCSLSKLLGEMCLWKVGNDWIIFPSGFNWMLKKSWLKKFGLWTLWGCGKDPYCIRCIKTIFTTDMISDITRYLTWILQFYNILF